MTEAWAEFEKYEQAIEAKGEAKGRAEGKSEFLLTLMRARGIAVSASEEAHISACRDSGQLSRWLVRAITATDIGHIIKDSDPSS